MPAFSNFQQLGPYNPQTWWVFGDTTWTTVSFTTSSWVISLGGDKTLTFTSASGFTAPRFAGDMPGGVVEAIELKVAGVSQATVSGLTTLGATPSDVAASPLSLLSRADTFSGSTEKDSFWGQNGDDSLSGGAGNDNLMGDDVGGTYAGADTLDGGAGDDSVYGGRGANLVMGGEGDDIVSTLGGTAFGGAGSDTLYGTDSTLYGDDGADTITASATTGAAVTAYGGLGDDMLYANGGTGYAGAVVLDGGAGTDTANVTYAGGDLTPTRIGNISLVSIEQVQLSARVDINLATYGAARVDLFGSIRAEGSSGNDTIMAVAAGAQTISGGLGDDILVGGNDGWGGYNAPYVLPGVNTSVTYPAYYDIADYSSAANGVTVDLRIKTAQATGQGVDTLSGFEGVIGSAYGDVLIGALGDTAVRDPYRSSSGPDRYLGARLDGGGGNDALTGTAEADTLSGGTGDDSLTGGDGNDVLNGGAGSDFMTGGLGADIFGVSLDGGVETITDLDVSTDKLLLTGGVNFTGVLAWNKATRQLFWDADGDAGAGAPRVVAEVGGSNAGTLGQANLDAAFTPAILRTIASDGTVTNVQFAPTAPQTGTAGNDTLVGTSGPDTLQGLAGADVLDGRAGVDVLSGGGGADKFHLMLDGSVDQLTDFSSAQGDFMLLVESDGSIVNGAGGLLIWDTPNRLLLWDSDSDAGPSAAVAFAQFTAGHDFNPEVRTAFAAGFQPSGVREIAGDGRSVETVFDWGVQAFDHTLTYFTAAHVVERFETYFDNGARSDRYWDVQSTQTWDSRVADYDAQGRMTAYAVYNDDGSRQVFQFDIGNTRPWERLVESYDALGRLTEQGIKNDDGTASERFVDTYDTQPWAYSIDNYNAQGGLVNHTLYKADGSAFVG